jgi:hypothetical protein
MQQVYKVVLFFTNGKFDEHEPYASAAIPRVKDKHFMYEFHAIFFTTVWI